MLTGDDRGETRCRGGSQRGPCGWLGVLVGVVAATACERARSPQDAGSPASAAASPAHSPLGDAGSPRAAWREIRTVPAFDALDAAGDVAVVSTRGASYTCAVEDDARPVDRVTTQVRDGTLYVHATRLPPGTAPTTRVIVTGPKIRRVRCDDAVVSLSDLQEDSLAIVATGRRAVSLRKCTVRRVQASLSERAGLLTTSSDIDRITVNARGASHADVGRCGRLEANVQDESRVAHYSGEDLGCERMNLPVRVADLAVVRARGSGSVRLGKVRRIDVDLGDSSEVIFKTPSQIIRRRVTGKARLAAQHIQPWFEDIRE